MVKRDDEWYFVYKEFVYSIFQQHCISNSIIQNGNADGIMKGRSRTKSQWCEMENLLASMRLIILSLIKHGVQEHFFSRLV